MRPCLQNVNIYPMSICTACLYNKAFQIDKVAQYALIEQIQDITRQSTHATMNSIDKTVLCYTTRFLC